MKPSKARCPSEWGKVNAHHLDEWHLNGGETNVDRMASLCRHHHGVTHRNGWAMHTAEDGWHWWQTPTGHTFWSQRHQRQRTDPPPPPRTDDG